VNLALRDIRYNKGRFVLTCLGLGLLLSIVMGMGGIYQGLIVEGLAVLHDVQADLWVVQKDTLGPFADDSRVPEDLQYTLRSVPGVAETGPITFRYMQLDYQGRKLRFYLVGYRWDGMGGPRRLLGGRPISQKHYELVADKKLGLKLGDTLHFGLHDYTVVGLTEDRVSPSGDPVIYASLPDAQELQFQKNNEAIRNARARLAVPLKELQARLPGLAQVLEETVDGIVSDTHIVNAILVRIDPGATAETVAAHIARWKHYAALTNGQEEEILTQIVIERSKRQLGLFRVILLIVSLVIIALIVYTLTMDKIRELATLKLIGAPNHRIVGLIMQQSLAMGTLGYLIGAAFIYATYDQFPKRVVLVPLDLGVLFLIVMAICMVASLYGVRTALKVDPSVVLGA
jgi:putative ABC transport system permease protein